MNDPFGFDEPYMSRRLRRQVEKRAAEAKQIVLRLPDRTSTIELGNRKTRSRATGEAVRADDAITDKLIERALSERSLRDIVDLYAILDAEEAEALAKPRVVVTPYMRRKAKAGIVDCIRVFGEMADDYAKRGYLEAAPGAKNAVRVPPYLTEQLRFRR